MNDTQKMQMIVTEIVDPLNGKTEDMFPDNFIKDNDTIRDLTNKELTELGFRVKKDKCPVGLIYKNDDIVTYEFSIKRFESMDELKDWISDKKVYTIGGKFGSHDESYVIRTVELPMDYDFEYSEGFVSIYIGIDSFCGINKRDFFSKDEKIAITKEIVDKILTREKPPTISKDFFETLDELQSFIQKTP